MLLFQCNQFPLLLLLTLCNAWNTLPPQFLKTSFGYQVLSVNQGPKIKKLRCDTPFLCKSAVVENAIDTCLICEEKIGLPASPYYGADKDVEVSPYDQVHLPTLGEEETTESETQDEASKPELTGEALIAANKKEEEEKELEKKKQHLDPNHGCPPREDDEFVLPCCTPKRSLDGEFMVEEAPTSFLETTRVQKKRLRVNGFMGDMAGAAVGAAGAIGAALTPCCGTGPSCCRWCKDICDDLENVNMQRLWWSLCNGADRDDTEKTNWYRRIKQTMFPSSGQIGGGGQSANSQAMAGAAGMFRL